MIEFLVTMFFFCVVVYVIYLVVGFLKLPSPISTIIYLIIGLVLVVWLLNYFGIYHSDVGNLRVPNN